MQTLALTIAECSAQTLVNIGASGWRIIAVGPHHVVFGLETSVQMNKAKPDPEGTPDRAPGRDP